MTNEVYNDELVGLLEGEEDHIKEFKSAEVIKNPSDDNRRKIARQLVAFANREGGYLIFGVDDETREVEGITLDDELSLGTLSEVAHDRCDPKIEFSRRFFSDEMGDVAEGDVFVVKVKQRRSIPHAVVQASGRDIKTREYRIRAGDETRLVSTEELEWLFDHHSPQVDYNGRAWFVYLKTEDGLSLPKLDLPESQSILTQFYWALSDDDKEQLVENDADDMSNLVRELAPFGFISNLCGYHRQSWKVEKIYEGTLEASPSISWGFHHVEEDTLEPDRKVSMQKINISDIDVSGLDKTILAGLSIDPWDAFQGEEFVTPPGVEVSLDLYTTAEKSDAYTRIPTLVFQKPDSFSFEIEFGRRLRWGRGPPSAHPINNLRTVEDSLGELSDALGTVEFQITLDADFEFPDQPDPEVAYHQMYGDQLVGILEENWDAYEFQKSLPDHKIYQLDYKLDAILRSLGFDQSYF